MTSQQLQRKLADAIGIIERCERVFADIAIGESRELRDTDRAIVGFMDAHRQDLAEGGAS